mgnify:CR=1 FL=1
MDRWRRSSTRTFVLGPRPGPPRAEVPAWPPPPRVTVLRLSQWASPSSGIRCGRTRAGAHANLCSFVVPTGVAPRGQIRPLRFTALRCGTRGKEEVVLAPVEPRPAATLEARTPCNPMSVAVSSTPPLNPTDCCRRTAPNLRNFPSGGTPQSDARTTLQPHHGRAAIGRLVRSCRSSNFFCLRLAC